MWAHGDGRPGMSSVAAGGQGRIRTTVAFAPDLQSGPFNHSGTCPSAFMRHAQNGAQKYTEARPLLQLGKSEMATLQRPACE